MKSFEKPVFILGAPRSGTSLLQKVLREHSAFVSVPREADMIWFQYTHPKNNNWISEGISPDKISSEDVENIQKSFHELAVSASSWSLWSSTGLMDNAITASIIRACYPVAKSGFKILRKISKPNNQNKRLLDKSVHMGLWLDLVLKVFPDALIIHITRDPKTCIPSMISGWKDPDRFQTFKLPKEFRLTKADSEYWKFHMPKEWQAHTNDSFENIAAFQWLSIQEKILEFKERNPSQYMKVSLEDLSESTPNVLKNICQYLELEYDEYFENIAQNLPVVNARKTKSSTVNPLFTCKEESKTRLNLLASKLGYDELSL